MINYVNKGIGLLQVIRKRGHWLKNVNGQWISSDDTIVQQIIDDYDPNLLSGLNGFLLYWLNDTGFKQAANVAKNQNPIVVSLLLESLKQSEKNDFLLFESVYPLFVSLGNVSQQKMDEWSQKAEELGLPNFVVVKLKENL